MDNIRQYLLTITAASILCGIISGIFGKKGTTGSIIKLLTGLVLAITAISPLTKIDLSDLSVYTETITQDADSFVADGEAQANTAAADIIKSQTEAYILDKASSMSLNVTADVALAVDGTRIPVSVHIQGAVSPYAKQVLGSFIANELGISEENQSWT